MDALSFGSYFLIKRFNLHNSVNDIGRNLSQTLEPENGYTPVQQLVLRFNHHRHLVPALGSWLYSGDGEKLTISDVIELVGATKIQTLAKRLLVAPGLLAEALADLIPVMIKKAANNGELCGKQLH